MLRKPGRLLAFGLILCLLLGLAPASSESMHTEVENPSMEAEVLLGYDGLITFGKAIPVRVTIRNSGADLDGTLAVNTYVNKVKYDRYETEISVPAGGERTFVIPVTAQTQQDVFTAEILRDGEVLLAVNASPAGIINPSAMMVGVLSTRPRSLANLDITQENDVLFRYEYWQTVELTPETLPDEKKLLDSFGIIVLDDVDPAALSEKQQKALKEWVLRGHVLLCGGGRCAPQNLAFLGEMTALRAEDFTVSDQVIPALESFLGQKTTDARPQAAICRMTGAEPLAADEDGNGLLWREEAGSGAVYTMAWEAGDAALNAEAMMHPFFQQLMVFEDSALYRNLIYYDGASGARIIPGEDSRLEVRNPMGTAAAVIAGCAVLAGAAWFLLRRRGKTSWMWAVLPFLALAAAAAVVLLSGSSDMNSPVSAAAVNITQDESGVTTRFTGVIAAAPRPGIHSYGMEGEELDAILYDNNWYGEDEDGTLREPAVLRAVYRRGARSEIAVSAETPWEPVRLEARRAETEAGSVDAEIWKEKDGFHGFIQNNLDSGLKEGAVVSAYGFVRIPALAPGESTEFVLLSETAVNASDPVFENGKIYLNAGSSIYGVTNQMLFGQNGEEYGTRESTLVSMISSACEYLSGETGEYGSTGAVVFTYCAEPEKLVSAAVVCDGRETKAASTVTLFNAKIRYLAVGKTGVVFRAPGMDRAVRCEIDSNGLPAGDMPEDTARKYNSYSDLNDLPTFRFTPEGIREMQIEEMTLGIEEWYVKETKGYVLDPQTREWTEIKLNAPLEDPERWLDGDGNLYCQFRPVNAENYISIPLPTLTVEGTVR